MGRGVFLIRTHHELDSYLTQTDAAYIQEYLQLDRDMRIVIIGHRIVHSYWRIAAQREFRTNVALGGSICLDPIPHNAQELALHTARTCGWDDVGIDICEYNGQLYVLEGNMKYGKEGFRKAGIDYTKLMESLIENDYI